MKNIIITALISLCTLSVFAQKGAYAEQFINVADARAQTSNYKFTADANNPLQFILANLFVGYKRFLSSQDVSGCSFTPSCSVYALQALQHQGVVIGAVNFFDRFARCNALSPEHYEKDYQQRLLIDPLRNVKYKIIDLNNTQKWSTFTVYTWHCFVF